MRRQERGFFPIMWRVRGEVVTSARRRVVRVLLVVAEVAMKLDLKVAHLPTPLPQPCRSPYINSSSKNFHHFISDGRANEVVASSTRRERSLHRSDSFQTRQQFARESGMSYSTYGAALTGQQQQQHQAQQTQTQLPPPIVPTTSTTTAYPGYPLFPTGQPGYIPYNPYQQPPQPYPYSPYPPPPMIPNPPAGPSSTPRDTPSSRGPSRPDSRTSSPASHRNDPLNFHPNPFAREFVPIGSSGSGVGHPPRPRNSAPNTPPHPQRNSATPPSTQQVKTTASFEGNPPSSAPGTSRPISPTPVYARSQSATSMRPTNPGVSTPPVSGYVGFLPGGQALPFPPPKLSTPRQTEYGPPITVGTIRYIANGQPSTFSLPSPKHTDK